MQKLLQTLQDHDLGHLKVIAELWGIELPPGSALDAATYLSTVLASDEFTSELVDGLSPTTKHVLFFIIERGGHVLLPDLIRKFGQIREMGPGRRDREKPWRNPISPLEDLWYRGLCARMMIDTPNGAEEQVFIPLEIIRGLSPIVDQENAAFGYPAPIPDTIVKARPSAVEDVTTLLAHLRREAPLFPDRWHLPEKIASFFLQPASVELLLMLLLEGAIVDQTNLEPEPEETKTLLGCSSSEILERLQFLWSESVKWNDLAHTPGLTVANNEWPNDPLVARRAIIDQVKKIPEGMWWDLEGFVSAFHDSSPSFQRQAGDFDSWYLLGERDGEFLRGFEFWDRVEGDFIRYILSGPMHWLGFVDIGLSPNGHRAVAIRLSPWAIIFLQGQAAIAEEPEVGWIRIQPDGLIRTSQYSDRAMRYQICRFAEWVAFNGEEYTYRLTPSSLNLAAKGGLKVRHIESILSAACENVPPVISKALQRWDARGAEARLERNLILFVQDPETLESLLANPRTARYIKERLNPTTALIDEANHEKLIHAAAKAGLLIDLPGFR